MANRGGRSHQRAQTAPWIESVSLSRRRWHATVGGLGRDRRQSNQYRSIYGSNAQWVENVSDEWRSAKRKRQRCRKITVRKELSGWVQDIARRRLSFLRRRVARNLSSRPRNRACWRYFFRTSCIPPEPRTSHQLKAILSAKNALRFAREGVFLFVD